MRKHADEQVPKLLTENRAQRKKFQKRNNNNVECEERNQKQHNILASFQQLVRLITLIQVFQLVSHHHHLRHDLMALFTMTV